MTEEKTEIFFEKMEDRILQLIYLAEVNIECCHSVHNFFKKQKEGLPKIDYVKFLNQDKAKYLVLSANNHFFESVGIVHTLLRQVNRESRELSFQLYKEKVLCENCLEDKTQDFLFEIKNLWKEFKKEKFSEIRHKFVAHKEFKNIGDPGSIAVFLTDHKWVKKLDQLIKKLKNKTIKFFKDPIFNNYLMNSKRGLENMLDNVKKEHE